MQSAARAAVFYSTVSGLLELSSHHMDKYTVQAHTASAAAMAAYKQHKQHKQTVSFVNQRQQKGCFKIPALFLNSTPAQHPSSFDSCASAEALQQPSLLEDKRRPDPTHSSISWWMAQTRV